MARHRERAEQEEFLAGILAAAVANYSLGAPKKALTPADFMPSQWAKRTQEQTAPVRPVSRKLVAQNVRCFLAGRMSAQEESI